MKIVYFKAAKLGVNLSKLSTFEQVGNGLHMEAEGTYIVEFENEDEIQKTMNEIMEFIQNHESLLLVGGGQRLYKR